MKALRQIFKPERWEFLTPSRFLEYNIKYEKKYLRDMLGEKNIMVILQILLDNLKSYM